MYEKYADRTVTEYAAFVEIVDDVGFMPFSRNSIDFISLEALTKTEQWHTDLPSDPWPWRVQIEADHKAAYAKVFEKKPGFISLEWYPVFIAARRKQRNIEDLYYDGLLSNHAKQIYSLFDKHDILATHEIKALCGFSKDTASKYEAAMNELQMYMLITTNGMKRKISSSGEPFGWPATAYSTVEFWAGEELYAESMNIKPSHAAEQILEQINALEPNADPKKIRRFAGI